MLRTLTKSLTKRNTRKVILKHRAVVSLKSYSSSSKVFEIEDSEFDEKVIQASKKKPVILDCWASWCGPCRVLAPKLEKHVNNSSNVVLAKLDIDKNDETVMKLRVTSVPSVFAFVNGKIVDQFVGNLPEEEISKFVTKLNESTTK
eukprot:TRINITY_DN3580_c0_g1_i1.p1 TRINITY_DN3580_c0_g1~~TRINITY_DN3580_c0_g1_i1.p1  ORF type:complete len:146 (+),score=22.80 TRINITY_DN3580_c0_g1_i1:40-477(+)